MKRTWFIVPVSVWLCAQAAWAQDARGPSATAADADPRAPLLQGDAQPPQNGPTVVLGASYAKNPLVTYVSDSGETTDVEARVGDVVTGEVGFSYGFANRFAIGVQLPVVLTATGTDADGGPALGDIQVFAPIALLKPKDTGFGLAITPYLDIPGGADERQLGDKAVGGGIWAHPGFRTETVSVSGTVGVDLRPVADYSFGTVPSGPWLRYGVAASVALSDHWGIGVEATASSRLYDSLIDTGTPAIALASVRGRANNGLFWAVGAGPALSRGVGSPAVEALLRVGWSPAVSRDPTVLSPVAGGTTLHVLDDDGRAVRNAEVRLGGDVIAHTDANGDVRLPAELKWKKGVVLHSDGFADVDVPEPTDKTAVVAVALHWTPTAFLLRVTDADGKVIPEAFIEFMGPVPAPLPIAVEEGRQRWDLPAGTWVLDVSAPGKGRQIREVAIPRGRGEAMVTDVVLLNDAGKSADLALVITDERGSAVDGAQILIDGKPVGTTTNSGKLTLSGLGEGAHAVSIASELYADVIPPAVKLGKEGSESLAVAMPFRPGSVAVSVKGPDGAVVDALVRFDGPASLPPMAVGSDGTRVFVLRPGEWKMLVSSTTLGLQQRDLVVPEGDHDPLAVDIVLRAAETGSAEFKVAVVDYDGQPVDGAEVLIDGESYGKTSTGGTLSLDGLDPGTRDIEVRAPRFQATQLAKLEISRGYQERLVSLAWNPGTVRVTAKSPDGTPVNAAVRLAGPATAGGSLGPSGVGFFELTPGSWQMLASSQTYGLQTRTIDVTENDANLISVDLVMTPVGGGRAGLALSVVDPEGNPVDSAEVLFDGDSLGETSTGGSLEAGGLPSGTHEVQVKSDQWAPSAVEKVKLTNDKNATVPIKLGWAPGTVQFTVRGPDGPVDDAILRLAGPEVLRPVTVDAQGRRQFVLPPGEWQVLVSSTSLGIRQTTLTVAAGDATPRREEITFGTQVAGSSVVLLRVRDLEGEPVSGAEVKIDDVVRGTTSANGAVLISDLAPGKIRVSVSAPNYVVSAPTTVTIDAGSREIYTTMVALPVSFDVVARQPSGAPVDAKLTFEGPTKVSAVNLGNDGFETVSLPPGHWEVFATAPSLGVKRQTLDIVAGKPVPRLLFDLETARVQVGERDVTFVEKVFFDNDKDTIAAGQDAKLTEVANTLLSRPDILRIEIQGHTDTTGGLTYNMQLSLERAEAVRTELVARGVPPERLLARGYGPLRPIADNASEDGRQANRRVEFVIIEAAAPAEN